MRLELPPVPHQVVIDVIFSSLTFFQILNMAANVNMFALWRSQWPPAMSRVIEHYWAGAGDGIGAVVPPANA
jgi:hypothetical protein